MKKLSIFAMVIVVAALLILPLASASATSPGQTVTMCNPGHQFAPVHISQIFNKLQHGWTWPTWDGHQWTCGELPQPTEVPTEEPTLVPTATPPTIEPTAVPPTATALPTAVPVVWPQYVETQGAYGPAGWYYSVEVNGSPIWECSDVVSSPLGDYTCVVDRDLLTEGTVFTTYVGDILVQTNEVINGQLTLIYVNDVMGFWPR